MLRPGLPAIAYLLLLQRQVCCRHRTPPTRDVRDGMGKRCRAPHSKAAGAARNRRLSDHLRQPVRHSPAREEAPQWIAATPRNDSPSAARRDALECGVLRRFPSRIAVAREQRWQDGVRPARCRFGCTAFPSPSRREGPPRRDHLRLVGVNSAFDSAQATCRPLPGSLLFSQAARSSPRSHDPQSAEVMRSTQLPDEPDTRTHGQPDGSTGSYSGSQRAAVRARNFAP